MTRARTIILSAILASVAPGTAAEARTFFGKCARLDIGESVRIPDVSTGTGLPANYRLERVSENEYRALVDLKFRGGETKTREEREALRSEWIRKTTECLEKVNPFLSGPHGEKLTIEISSGTFFEPINNQRVKIVEAGTRSHSEAWKEDASCGTIIHETFHHLGLVDEYEETSSGYNRDGDGKLKYVSSGAELFDYDCRAKGPSDSIMSAHWLALKRISERTYATACNCPPGPNGSRAECLARLEATDPRSLETVAWGMKCPADTIQVLAEVSEDDDGGRLCEAVQERFGKIPTLRVLCKRHRDSDSLLLPAQFRSIVYPGCREENETYYSCAKNAYKTSKEHNGFGCAPAPDACDSEDNAWLL